MHLAVTAAVLGKQELILLEHSGCKLRALCSVGARGYLHSYNRFLSIFGIPPVIVQAPIMSCVNPMSIHDLQ